MRSEALTRRFANANGGTLVCASGNLAAAMTLKLRDSARRSRAQLLYYPAVEFSRTRASFHENADGSIIRVADTPATNAMYCLNPAGLQNPLAAPLLTEFDAGLPPAYVAIAEHNPLRHDGAAYPEALARAGVPVTLDRGEGLIHRYLRAKEYCEDSRGSLKRGAL